MEIIETMGAKGAMGALGTMWTTGTIGTMVNLGTLGTMGKLLHMGTLMKVQLCAIEKLRLGFGSSILNFDELLFLSPLSKEGVTYLLRKPNAMPIENKPETGQILTLT